MTPCPRWRHWSVVLSASMAKALSLSGARFCSIHCYLSLFSVLSQNERKIKIWKKNQILCYNRNKKKCKDLKEMVDFILWMAFESDKPTRRFGPSNQQATNPMTITWVTRTKFISKIEHDSVSNTV